MSEHSTDPAKPGEGFWRFSLAFYAQPGVGAALVELQDREGRDVNVMLFALWLGIVHGHRLDTGRLATAEDAARDEAVAGMRGLRRQLPRSNAMRGRAQMLEIAGERAVQYRLAGSGSWAVPGSTDRAGAALANFSAYVGAAPPAPVGAAIERFTRRA